MFVKIFRGIFGPESKDGHFCGHEIIVDANELIRIIVNYLVGFTLLRHQYPMVAHLDSLSNLAFGPKSSCKIMCRVRLVISGSSRVLA